MTTQIETLATIAPAYDVIVFDQWGVLHDGTAPYPGAIDAVGALPNTCAVLSNSGKRARPNAERITAMGFAPDAFASVMTSGEALWRDIDGGKIAAQRVFAVERATGDAAAWAQGLNINLVTTPDTADAILMMGLPDGTQLADWSDDLQSWHALGLPMYCSNPDRQSPRKDGLVVSPGAIAFAYIDIGGQSSFYGKPHLPIFNAMETVFGKGRYLMVGDSMEHDIAGAQTAGWDSLLIQNGLYSSRFATDDSAQVIKQLASETSCAPPTYTMEGLQ